MARGRGRGHPSGDQTDSRLSYSSDPSGYDATEGGPEQHRDLTPLDIDTRPVVSAPLEVGPSPK